MPFQDRFVIGLGRQVPPGKFYFSTGGREMFGVTSSQQVDGAADYLRDVFTHRGTLPPFWKDWTFMLGAVWGDKGNKQRIVDIFGFPITGDEWPGNPEAYSLIARARLGEPVQIQREDAVSCTEGLQIIGGELGIRAKTSSLADYIGTEELPKTGLFQGFSHHILL